MGTWSYTLWSLKISWWLVILTFRWIIITWNIFVIKVPKCYRDTDNQTCTDLILTNKLRNFQNSCIIETLTSYFHKMTVSAWRMQFRKLKPRVLFYEIFINSLKVKLGTQSISLDENGFLSFCKICTETLNKCAPRKRKTIRANLSPFWI